jgi:hypothetical protein
MLMLRCLFYCETKISKTNNLTVTIGNLKFVSRTIPQSGGYETPQLAEGFHTRDYLSRSPERTYSSCYELNKSFFKSFKLFLESFWQTIPKLSKVFFNIGDFRSPCFDINVQQSLNVLRVNV